MTDNHLAKVAPLRRVAASEPLDWPLVRGVDGRVRMCLSPSHQADSHGYTILNGRWQTKGHKSERRKLGNTSIESSDGISFGLNSSLYSLPIHVSEFAISEWAERPELPMEPRRVTIRAGSSSGHRNSASILVKRMYAWRNYHNVELPSESGDRITLVAIADKATLGTITIGFDASEGLYVDEEFRDEANALRSEGVLLCEFIKLAVDRMVHSKRLLASLFHVAFIYAHEVKGYDKVMIEVNPRHVRFYERMLGFRVMAASRVSRRVNAPAVLLGLDLSYVQRRISDESTFGQVSPRAPTKRSLYAYGFSTQEQAGIANRLRGGDVAGASAEAWHREIE